MNRKKRIFAAESFRSVLGFTFRHWARQPWRIAAILVLIMLATVAQMMTPIFAGRLVDAIATGSAEHAPTWNTALVAFWLLAAFYLASVVLRQLTFLNIIVLTLKMMSEIAAGAFHRVQRFSTDWHANSFAGSTVRKITRGMWALDLLNDTLLVALFPSAVMLFGATVILGSQWPVMGLVVGLGSIVFIGVTVSLSVGFVAPAATLANAWDTKLGGALADAVSCNPVVKAFGAETREEERLTHVVEKWRHRTRRTWRRGTFNGGVQGTMMVLMQTGILGVVLYLWQNDLASAGDMAFVLTMFFVLGGHLNDVGMHIRNLQRSINDMEELVGLYDQPLGIEDKPGAEPIRIGKGAIAFDRVTFRYGAHATPLYKDFSVDIRAGERVGLVGHSGSGKTTFVKLIQRLYDVNRGAITIDGVNIADVTQQSLRSQIAIVQQEPVLFHRSLAENIAYARPGASRAEIIEAARQASAHEFICELPRATTRWWVSAASSSRAASASALPSPGRSSPMRRSSSSMRRLRASIPRAKS